MADERGAVQILTDLADQWDAGEVDADMITAHIDAMVAEIRELAELAALVREVAALGGYEDSADILDAIQPLIIKARELTPPGGCTCAPSAPVHLAGCPVVVVCERCGAVAHTLSADGQCIMCIAGGSDTPRSGRWTWPESEAGPRTSAAPQ